MISYTKKSVSIITLTITVLLYVIISVIWLDNNKKETITQNTTEENNITEETEENIQTNEHKLHIWRIKIPAINVTANISEGTTQNVIAKYVGHFSKTSKLDGNIGLAAHNRGIGVESYFKNIKNLQIGDVIIYQKDEEVKIYKVTENVVIDETDWTYLENTNDNRITLITCVENKPEYRRCVQALEV